MTGRRSAAEDRDSSCSSSIGRCSDCSSAGGGGEDSGEAEVQSALKGPLDTMDMLELGLPIDSSYSSFHRGKSKSFTNLQGISSWSPPANLVAKLACTSSNRKRKQQQQLLLRDSWDSNNTALKDPNLGKLPKRLAGVNNSMPTLGSTAPTAAESSSSGSNSSATSFEEDQDAVPRSWLPEGLRAARR